MANRIAFLVPVVLAASCASVDRDVDHPEGGVTELTALAQGGGSLEPISIPRVLDDGYRLTVAYESDVRINGDRNR